MKKGNINQEFRLKNIEERKKFLLEQNELMSKKHRKAPTILNYTEHFLILVSAITGCISIPSFASFLGIPIRSSVIRLKTCAIIKK